MKLSRLVAVLSSIVQLVAIHFQSLSGNHPLFCLLLNPMFASKLVPFCTHRLQLCLRLLLHSAVFTCRLYARQTRGFTLCWV